MDKQYGYMNDLVKLIADHNGCLIVENKRGERFTVGLSKVEFYSII